ncbi:MAG TPA: STAS domain-containing protein [Solirubrobacterales bacterium]
MPILKLSERRLTPEAVEIVVDGELDLAVASRLQQAIDESGSGSTLIHLARRTFIDSTGIAVVLRARRLHGQEGGGRMVVHSPSVQVLRVLKITGLTENGLVFPDRDEALATIAALEAH